MWTKTDQVVKQWKDKDGNVLLEELMEEHGCHCGYRWFGLGGTLPETDQEKIPVLACPSCKHVDYISIIQVADGPDKNGIFY